jgi:endo-1,4-beta-xylanase
MIKRTLVCVLVISIFGFIGCKPEQENQIPPYVEDGSEIYRFWPFSVGAAAAGARTDNTNGKDTVNANALNPKSRQHELLKHFNVVAAENEMKPENIMPSSESGSYNWKDADALVEYAEETGKKVRGHVLIWHDQTPAWFFPSAGTGAEKKQKLYERMENHIKSVFEKYGGRIDTWDVCNEVVDHETFSGGGARKDSKYTQIMEAAGLSGINRYEYVLNAFKWARKYADENKGENVKLYLTDFGIERPFPNTPAGQKSKIDAFDELVDYLIENGAPIDGVGFQGHLRLYDHPVSQISEGIDRFSAKTRKDGKKLKVQVCELDFSVFSGAKNEGSLTKLSGSVFEERMTDLAKTYREYFDMFEEKYNEGKLDMVLIWGISDGHSWLNNHPVSGRTDHPLLFDRDYEPKEAFLKLIEGRTAH